jgi:hypothetical protein
LPLRSGWIGEVGKKPRHGAASSVCHHPAAYHSSEAGVLSREAVCRAASDGRFVVVEGVLTAFELRYLDRPALFELFASLLDRLLSTLPSELNIEFA